MSEISISVDSNVAEVLRAFEVLPKRIQDAARNGLRLGLEAIRGGVQQKITDTFRTTAAGGLRQSIQATVEGEGDQFEGRISSDKIYAAIHEFGTVGKGGTFADIVPVNAKVLRFELQTASRIAPKSGPWKFLKSPKQGQRIAKNREETNVIFCKRVSLPPRPYFFPAVRENLHQVPDQIKQQMDAALSKTGKSK